MQTMQVDGWFFAEAAKSFLTLRCKDDLRKLWRLGRSLAFQRWFNEMEKFSVVGFCRCGGGGGCVGRSDLGHVVKYRQYF